MQPGAAIADLGARHHRRAVEEAGGQIHYGAAAREILVTDGAVAGVALADGRVLPGQTVQLGEMKLLVVGTYMTGKPIFDSAIIIPISRMRELRGGEDVTNLLAVRVEDGADRVRVAREVERHPNPDVRVIEDSTLTQAS